MIHERDQVVLMADLEGSRFKTGDVGVVVHIYKSGLHFEVEFFSVDGETLDVVTVPASAVRPTQPMEVMHARALD